MMEDWAAACLNCGAVTRNGPNCPDCGTRLGIVPLETAITLTALKTIQRRKAEARERARMVSRNFAKNFREFRGPPL